MRPAHTSSRSFIMRALRGRRSHIVSALLALVGSLVVVAVLALVVGVLTANMGPT